jgi:S1-C subfamily serine protease
VTNAHVLAGIDRPQVEERNGRKHRATAIFFDPNLDLAVLRTERLNVPALRVLASNVERGTGGAVLGYPGGGPFTAGPGAVLRQFNARGRDIYGRGLTERQVYQLQAAVRQGNSGGPFANADGVVLGVIFAASTTDSNVGYALTGTEVAPRVQQAAAQRQAVDTGPCAA